MRSYNVYGYTPGAEEVFMATVYSPSEGTSVFQAMRHDRRFAYMRVRDVFKNLCFEYNLITGEKVT